jgi:hypothetical protein
MADFSIASQIRPMQLPDPLQQYAQFNQLALHQAQLAEVQRAANEQNQLRSLLETGVDRNSPEFLKQVYKISPTTGMTLEKGQNELKTAGLTQQKLQGDITAQGPALQKAKLDAIVADTAHTSEMLNKVAALPDDQAKSAYDFVRANAVRAQSNWDAVLPKQFERDTIRALALKGEEAARQHAELTKPTVVTDASGRMFQQVKDAQGRIIGTTEVTPGTMPAVAQTARAATAGALAPSVDDAQAMRTAQIEGTGKNPMSSAQGLHQFIDSTFVGTAKKVFPELASKSPAEILALRGTKLADGTPIESALEQRFRADNIASLTSAGIQPTPGNTYLAHFLGAGGARSVLGADPNTPVTQLLSADAIAANKSVLEGKTAGEVAAWAANKFGNQPGLAASMTAGNARLGGAPAGFVPASGAPMSPGAPTVNNALTAGMMINQAPMANALAAPQIMPVAQTPAPQAMPVAQPPASVTAGMSPAARADYEKKTAEAAAAQETAKANRKEGAQQLLHTAGGENAAKIENLINASTSGLVEHAGAAVKGMVPSSWGGGSTPGMKNIAQLDHIAKQMTFELLNGKLSAGVSDQDRKFVQGLVSDISNPDKPAEERLAGFRQLKNTLEAWSSGKDVEIAAPATDKKTLATKTAEKPTVNGRAAAFTEGQTATGPNGAKIIFRNGQWTPQ